MSAKAATEEDVNTKNPFNVMSFFGGILFTLSLIILVVLGVKYYKHRRGGGTRVSYKLFA